MVEIKMVCFWLFQESLIERAASDVLEMVTSRILPLLVPDNAATI
jgi:hypothetical protein